MILDDSLHETLQRIERKESFVLNITAAWCPDCTERQAPNLPAFAVLLDSVGLMLVNLEVQKERRIFLSPEHQDFVDTLGGHGFPRTVLFVQGEAVDSDNVEVVDKASLTELAQRFLHILSANRL